jgi:hypothetical protein
MNNDYKDRLVIETNELTERLSKLQNFLDFHAQGLLDVKLSGRQRDLLTKQRDVMKEYLLILRERCKLEGITG